MEVQLQISFDIAPAAGQPLTVTPAQTTINGTVGVPLDGTSVAQVTGGTQPYSYALDSASDPVPDGVSFSEDGNGNITLTGTPATAGVTDNVILDIVDASGNQAQVKTKIARKIG